jgi:hypothetical protein
MAVDPNGSSVVYALEYEARDAGGGVDVERRAVPAQRSERKQKPVQKENRQRARMRTTRFD